MTPNGADGRTMFNFPTPKLSVVRELMLLTVENPWQVVAGQDVRP